jgi:hypothetical protein
VYSVIKDNVEIGITETPKYIRLQENGAYALCEERDAQGICYNDVVYHLHGKPEIPVEGIESVAVEQFDAGARILTQAQILSALLGTEEA